MGNVPGAPWAKSSTLPHEILIGHGAGTTNFVAGGTGTVRLGMHNNYITNTFTSNGAPYFFAV